MIALQQGVFLFGMSFDTAEKSTHTFRLKILERLDSVPPLPQIEAIQRDADAVECNRCGFCCKLPSGRDCKNLRRKPDGLTYCAIWGRAGRIGTPIGEGQVCSLVVFVPRLWKGCPYNAVKLKHGIVPEGTPEEE